MDFTKEIKGHTLEYFDDDHVYLVDGVIVQSITQMLQIKFGGKYRSVNKDTLKKASEAGTETHRAIEEYCLTGVRADIPEVRGFMFLERSYGLTVLENETPVILFKNDAPISAGRLDMVITQAGFKGIGGADIKRVSKIDKEYLGYQLNLYRIAYRQSYGIEWSFLRGIHLKDDIRKLVKIPINEHMAWDFINDYLKGGKDE